MSATRRAILEQMAEQSKVRTIKDKTYQILETGDATVKLPPQAIEVLSILFLMNTDTATTTEIREAMNKSNLKTKQEKYLIFQYYRKALMDAGFLAEVK